MMFDGQEAERSKPVTVGLAELSALWELEVGDYVEFTNDREPAPGQPEGKATLGEVVDFFEGKTNSLMLRQRGEAYLVEAYHPEDETKEYLRITRIGVA
jgi:hypothetical protein